MILNDCIAPSKDDLIWDEDNRFASWNHVKFQIPSGYDIRIVLYYNVLLGNILAQELKFRVTYEMGYDKETGGKYHCSLYFAEIGVLKKD